VPASRVRALELPALSDPASAVTSPIRGAVRDRAVRQIRLALARYRDLLAPPPPPHPVSINKATIASNGHVVALDLGTARGSR
jgi:hypothetical protein